MLRTSFTPAPIVSTALLIVALAPASSVAADDCMCRAFSDQQFLYVHDESVDVGPFFSSDGTLLTSAMQIERQKQKDGGTEILWCWSPHDPRCSPSRPAPENGPHALSRAHSGGATVSVPTWPRPLAQSIRGSAVLGGPRAGVRSRVERPPRA